MEEVNLSIISYSLNHIYGFVVDEEEDHPWFFLGIYGYPEENLKKDT